MISKMLITMGKNDTKLYQTNPDASNIIWKTNCADDS